MKISIELDCPQCGAPVDLEEKDHMLSCPYCGVRRFLHFRNHPRLMLPAACGKRSYSLLPYLRFKGAVYICSASDISNRIVDITRLGVPCDDKLPLSLGMRPQAMKLKPVHPQMDGDFVRFSVRADVLLARAGKVPGGNRGIFHRAFIGETLSVIYLPVYREGDRLHDGVTGETLGKGIELEDTVRNPVGFGLSLAAAVCPNCGWGLDGERSSVVLTCGNCSRAWETADGKLRQVRVEVWGKASERVLWLPFWRVDAVALGSGLETFDDFIRLTRQPAIDSACLSDVPLSFCIPAFKIRPRIFLNLARQMTFAFRMAEPNPEFPAGLLYPVTLPRREAVQCRKLVLAECAVDRKRIFPLLPTLQFSGTEAVLAYVPFTDAGGELVDRNGHIGISRRALDLGYSL